MRTLPKYCPAVFGSRRRLVTIMMALLWASGCDHTQKTPPPVVDAQQQQQVGVNDIVQMVQQHVSDPIIIQQIHTLPTVYHLSGADIEYLKSNGVSDPVVLEMQATANRAPQPVVGAAYVAPPPPPPIGVGLRVGGYWR